MIIACIYFKQEIALLEFAESCLRFSPQIAVRHPNAVFIEIGKCLGLYSKESFIARANVLVRRFKSIAHIEFAEDIPTALALAHFEVDSIEKLPLEALIDFGDPFLTDPVGRKSLEKVIESLTRLGIKNIKGFREIPVSQLPSRFGPIGLYCRQRIEGDISQAWPHWQPPEKYYERIELMSSEYCAHIEPLLFKAKEALDRLFSRLRGRFLRAEKMAFSIELEKFSTVKKPLRSWNFEFISPQGSTSGFLPILRERLSWDLSKEPIESTVIAIVCEVSAVVNGNESQRNFFHSRDDFDEAMGSLFGQLEESLGKGKVYWANITEDRIPEKSWQKVRKIGEEQSKILGKYPKRPTRILPAPIPVTVIENRIVFKGKTYKASSWSPVERLSPDWIDDVPARNYYRVELESGQALWLFSDPGHHYFLHGYFE